MKIEILYANFKSACLLLNIYNYILNSFRKVGISVINFCSVVNETFYNYSISFSTLLLSNDQ